MEERNKGNQKGKKMSNKKRGLKSEQTDTGQDGGAAWQDPAGPWKVAGSPQTPAQLTAPSL